MDIVAELIDKLFQVLFDQLIIGLISIYIIQQHFDNQVDLQHHYLWQLIMLF